MQMRVFAKLLCNALAIGQWHLPHKQPEYAWITLCPNKGAGNLLSLINHF